MSANSLTKSILLIINASPGCLAWRQNNHATRGRRNNVTAGVPDIIAIRKGQFIGIEVKFGEDKLSQAQIDLGANIEASGGRYIVVKTIDDFLEFWQKPGHK